jgi:hypothetical protein
MEDSTIWEVEVHMRCIRIIANSHEQETLLKDDGRIIANYARIGTEGKVFTDFDFPLAPTQQKNVQDERKEGGGYRASFEKVSLGLINGGGVEIQLTTYEGDIYIRKAK